VPMETKHLHLERGIAVGILVEMPTAPLLIIKAKRGYVMCGYLNMSAANKLGDVAGRVTGVKSFDDVLAAKVVEASDKAKELGGRDGMTGREFLNALM
jgi:uncharacterized protein YunC (DUF1805 family)